MLERAPIEVEQELGLIHTISIKSKDAPTVFLVHGRAGNVEVMRAFLRKLPKTWNIISVQAPFEDPIGGFSWWLLEEYKDYTEDINRAVDILEDFVHSALEYYELQNSQLVALGFSQGGALLSIISQTSPKLFKGVGMLASFLVKKVNVELVGLPKFFIAHGVKDEIASVHQARKSVKFLQSQGAEVEYIEDDVTHKVGIKGMKALESWLIKLF